MNQEKKKYGGVWKMSSGGSQPEERNCSVVWWHDTAFVFGFREV